MYKSQLLKVSLQESHLLLLCFAVAVAYDVVVQLPKFIELDLELHHLRKDAI